MFTDIDIEMEKLLAMSILSSTPAEVAGSLWMMNASLFKNGKKSGGVAEKQGPLSTPQSEKADVNKQKQQQKAKGSSCRPWFAPEFDGLNCFESLVSH